MDSLFYLGLGLGAVFCAYRAMVTQRLLICALYLAGVSALVSAILYLLGAHQVAVIELSVGAGLVTVLLVYALSVVGDDAWDALTVLPRWLAASMAAALAALLGALVFPFLQPVFSPQSPNLTMVLWQERVLDVWVQIALIFSGVMGVLGLLAESGEAHP